MATKLNEATLRSWMEKLSPRLLRLATGICRDRHQAEDDVETTDAGSARCSRRANEARGEDQLIPARERAVSAIFI